MKNIGSMRFQTFKNIMILEICFSGKIKKIHKNDKIRELKNEGEENDGQSTSPPSGNLVDGLPLVCSIKTVAQRGRLGACTQMHLTMKIMFLNVNAS